MDDSQLRHLNIKAAKKCISVLRGLLKGDKVVWFICVLEPVGFGGGQLGQLLNVMMKCKSKTTKIINRARGHKLRYKVIMNVYF